MIKLDENNYNFHRFFLGTVPKVSLSQIIEVRILRKVGITHFYERNVSTANYHHIRQQLQMMVLHPFPLSEPLQDSESNQWSNSCHNSPLEPIASARPFQNGCSVVRGRLKTSKMAKINIFISHPNKAKCYLVD